MNATDLIETAVNIVTGMGVLVSLLALWAVRERRKLRCTHRALNRMSEGWFRCRRCGKWLSDLEVLKRDLEVLKHNFYERKPK